jgi:hypothetical protein
MKIYLDFAFLENFFLNPDDSDTHYRLKRLLCSAQSPAELIVNFDFEEAYKNPEKKVIFRQIANRFPVSNLTFSDKVATPEFYETSTSALLFMDSMEEDTSKFGCFSLKSANLKKADVLLYGEGYRINRKNTDWSVFSNYKMPCNSLIITDNYLFLNDKNFESTLSILFSLMPDELTIDFDLTIIGFAAKDFKRLAEQAERLLNFLNKKYPYKVNLSIVRDDHHGRYIHTNYARFQSEKGFGLFQNNRIKASDETTLEYSPITEFGRQTNVFEVRTDELEKCRKILKTERIPDKQFGTTKNRLLA